MSIKIHPGQTTVVYPPAPGTPEGPCLGTCAHIDCRTMRQDAEALCPHCLQPLGFGCVQYLRTTTDRYTVNTTEPTMKHAACVDAAIAANAAVENRPDAPKEG
jgi:hypothetical protein